MIHTFLFAYYLKSVIQFVCEDFHKDTLYLPVLSIIGTGSRKPKGEFYLWAPPNLHCKYTSVKVKCQHEEKCLKSKASNENQMKFSLSALSLCEGLIKHMCAFLLPPKNSSGSTYAVICVSWGMVRNELL